MFTWICPKCGREVPPSYTECPNCAKAAVTEAPVTGEEQPPTAKPPQAATVPQEFSAPSRSASTAPPPPVRTGLSALPPALVALLATAGITGLLALLYFVVLPKKRSPIEAETTPFTQESPAATGSNAANPLAKYIEVCGIRLSREGSRAKIQYVVVNHSGAELPELRLQVQLVAGGKKEFEFPATLPSLGPYETRDLSTTVKTNLKPYEWPDWQALHTRFTVLDQSQ